MQALEFDEYNKQVILLGGNSAAGKTTLANKLVETMHVSVLLVDDVRIALQKVTTVTEQPDLHVFLQYLPADWKNPERIFRDWQRVGRAMVQPLKAIIMHHIYVPGAGKIIIEGDGIFPALALPETFAEYTDISWSEILQAMQVIFLIETDEDQIMANLRQRGRGLFNQKSPEEQGAFAHASALYGRWLRQEANGGHFSVLPARPRETVCQRFLRVLADER
ncbi:hypothetical protein KQH61_05690 [bacterium]|nr:hypothetical protein [bacterium]MCB2179395.1 hypothetical protein [bacterium]